MAVPILFLQERIRVICSEGIISPAMLMVMSMMILQLALRDMTITGGGSTYILEEAILMIFLI